MGLKELPLIINKAENGDEVDIYKILIDAFGNKYIKFTIFQSEKCINYLKRIIINHGNENNYIFTARGMEIFGFYFAIKKNDELFLNYIAIQSKYRKRGIGKILLNHYENLARSLNLHKCTLEVFESNRIALSWYESNGYEVQKRNYVARVNLGKINIRSLNGFIIDKDTYFEAEKIEKDQGFSKFDVYYKNNHIQLGIIGGDTYKILKHGGYNFEDIACLIINSKLPKRKWLLTTSEDEIECLDYIESKENILYMYKSINKGV